MTTRLIDIFGLEDASVVVVSSLNSSEEVVLMHDLFDAENQTVGASTPVSHLTFVDTESLDTQFFAGENQAHPESLPTTIKGSLIEDTPLIPVLDGEAHAYPEDQAVAISQVVLDENDDLNMVEFNLLQLDTVKVRDPEASEEEEPVIEPTIPSAYGTSTWGSEPWGGT